MFGKIFKASFHFNCLTFLARFRNWFTNVCKMFELERKLQGEKRRGKADKLPLSSPSFFKYYFVLFFGYIRIWLCAYMHP